MIVRKTMRIKTLLMTIVAVSLVSCEYRADIKDYTEKGTLPFPRIAHFIYKGHSYIFFDEVSGQCSVGGVVHDPDCECLK